MRFCNCFSVLVLLAGVVMGIRPAAAQPFADVTAEAGLAEFVAIPGDGHGPGAVFADLDNDGYPDLYLLGQDPVDAAAPYSSLYVNRPVAGGRAFTKRPAASGAAISGPGNGAVAGDYDNDGDLDLYVITYGPNVLFRNNLRETGSLSFTDVTAATDPTPDAANLQFGVGRARGRGCDGELRDFDNSLSAAWADVNRDGYLDLFVGTHNGFHLSVDEDGNFGFDPNRLPVQTDDPFPGSRDTLYLSNGPGADGQITFTDVTEIATATVGVTGYETAGGEVSNEFQCYASSNAVIFADFDLDLWPDLLVSNKTITPDDRDLLYRNLGQAEDGTWLGFEVVSYSLPSPCSFDAHCFGRMSPAAMGIDVGDPDNDGDFDIFITDIYNDPDRFPPPYNVMLFNDLWINQLADTGALGFVYEPAPRHPTSWGVGWQDFDNDGDEDVHVTSSFNDGFFVNQGGLVFSESAAAFGLANPNDARGNASADYDRDGRIDLLVINPTKLAQLGDSPNASILWRNGLDAAPAHHHLSVRLLGDVHGRTVLRSTRDAIGARVRVHADLNGDGRIGPGEVQTREVRSGSGNAASTSSLELEFGLALATEGTVEVFWPSGRHSTFEVVADQRLYIPENPILRALACRFGRASNPPLGTIPCDRGRPRLELRGRP